MASSARQEWTRAKTTAGAAGDKLKLKDDYGPMLERVEDMSAKLASTASAIEEMVRKYDIAVKKLDGMKKVYALKIENEIKTTNDNAGKAKLQALADSLRYSCTTATTGLAFFALGCAKALREAEELEKFRDNVLVK